MTYNITYLDNNEQLIRNTSHTVTKTYLVKQSYNKKFQTEFNDI